MKRFILLCSLGAILGLGAWVGWHVIETRSDACDCMESPYDVPRLALFNPFRPRTPEAIGNSVLKTMQSGHCETIPEADSFCAREKRFTIVGWKLTGRMPDKDGESLRYFVTRKDSDGGSFDDPIGMYIEQNGHTWTLKNIDLYY